jgi:ubiquinone/menaquinone biosynthesis C-methylase UbiE
MRTPDEINAMFCSGLLKYAKLEGKRILDIGCGNGDLVRYIAKKHSPQYIVGIEPFLSDWEVEESGGDTWKIISGNAHNLEFNDNEFDVIVSFSTFEHIADVKKALSEIKRTLKPYGRFYTEFMPIWTSAAGHHFIHKKDRWWTPEHIKMIPAWGHLYMSENEMQCHIRQICSDTELEKEILCFIYHSDYVNRCSRADLSKFILNSGMIVRYYEERPALNRLEMITGENKPELTKEIIDYAERKCISISELSIAGMQICLEKFSDIKEEISNG